MAMLVVVYLLLSIPAAIVYWLSILWLDRISLANRKCFAIKVLLGVVLFTPVLGPATIVAVPLPLGVGLLLGMAGGNPKAFLISQFEYPVFLTVSLVFSVIANFALTKLTTRSEI